MKTIAKTALVAGILGISLIARAASDGPEDKLTQAPTLADLIGYALTHSPEAGAAREAWKEKIERIRVEGGYPDPELMLEQTGFKDPMWSLRLTTMIPFPGKLAAATSMAATEAAMARFEVDRTLRDLAVSIRESAAEIAYLQKALEIASKNGELLDRLGKVSENSYAAKRAELIDIVRGRAQLSQVGFDTELLKELLAVEKARLNNRLGRESTAPLGAISLSCPSSLAYTVEEVEKLVRERAEELKVAGIEIERARTAREAAGLDSYPDFTVGVFKDPINASSDSLGVSVGVTLPLWFSKNAGKAAAAEAATRRAELMRSAKINDLRSEVRELYFRTGNALRLVNLYSHSLLPQAAKSLELAETWMKGGQGSFSDYAEIASTLYSFELALARAEADHAKYLARLERFAGQSLTARREGAK